ncbi:ribonuclease HI [Labilibacter marinus]|uniref:ribonuclease HI n=1 Tax=Labilibacter marinus TaxID=1477105 RepID=UPI00083334FB|nr:RNase H family protein [Labilibacter marinus]
MKQIYLFTDGSVHTQTKLGFGASLIVEDLNSSIEDAKQSLCIKQFIDTSSTKLELQILLFALENLKDYKGNISAYTDSQNILSLLSRREKLEKNKYLTASGKKVINTELYQQFYQLIDGLNIEFIKIKGHQKSSDKTSLDKLFTLVDKASRKALRSEIKRNQGKEFI